MFQICLNQNYEIYSEEKGHFGLININNFSEKFFVPIDFWDRNTYLKNWNCELKKLLEGFSCAKLITKIYNPENMNFFQAWVLYLENNDIFIQEQIFFLDELPKPFLIDDFYLSEIRREIYSEDGIKISTWKISKKDIYNFILSNHQNK